MAFAVAALILTTSVITVSAVTNYKILDGENETNVVSVKKEAGKILDEAGVKLEEGDKYIVDETQPTETKIEVQRAFDIEVITSGESKTYKTTKCAVKDFLASNNIILTEQNLLNCNLDDETCSGMQLVIDSVEVKEVTEQQEIPFTTTSKETDNLKKGKTKVETPGQNGIKEVTFSQKFLNGQLVESNPVSEKVIKEPVNQVNLVGTKVINKTTAVSTNASGVTTDNSGAPVNYTKTITGVITAYCDKGRTSTGKTAQHGVVAVDPRVIPYGTKLYIPGYGYAVAGDTGGAMRSGKVLIDLWFASNAEWPAPASAAKTGCPVPASAVKAVCACVSCLRPAPAGCWCSGRSFCCPASDKPPPAHASFFRNRFQRITRGCRIFPAMEKDTSLAPVSSRSTWSIIRLSPMKNQPAPLFSSRSEASCAGVV